MNGESGEECEVWGSGERVTGSSFEPLASLVSLSFRLFSDGGPASSAETKGLQYARYTVSEPNGHRRQ